MKKPISLAGWLVSTLAAIGLTKHAVKELIEGWEDSTDILEFAVAACWDLALLTFLLKAHGEIIGGWLRGTVRALQYWLRRAVVKLNFIERRLNRGEIGSGTKAKISKRSKVPQARWKARWGFALATTILFATGAAIYMGANSDADVSPLKPRPSQAVSKPQETPYSTVADRSWTELAEILTYPFELQASAWPQMYSPPLPRARPQTRQVPTRTAQSKKLRAKRLNPKPVELVRQPYRPVPESPTNRENFPGLLTYQPPGRVTGRPLCITPPAILFFMDPTGSQTCAIYE